MLVKRFSRTLVKIGATQMSDFKAKMHPIWFPLGLHHRPLWRSLQCSPRSPSCIEGGLLL